MNTLKNEELIEIEGGTIFRRGANIATAAGTIYAGAKKGAAYGAKSGTLVKPGTGTVLGAAGGAIVGAGIAWINS